MIRRKKISSLQKNSNHDFFDNRNGNVNDNYGDLWLTEGRKGKKETNVRSPSSSELQSA